MYLVIAILIFSFLIFIHEFGHFITAKLFDVKVNEFSIFMGPRILHWGKGETEYSLRLLPIGGFCAWRVRMAAARIRDPLLPKRRGSVQSFWRLGHL